MSYYNTDRVLSEKVLHHTSLENEKCHSENGLICEFSSSETVTYWNFVKINLILYGEFHLVYLEKVIYYYILVYLRWFKK